MDWFSLTSEVLAKKRQECAEKPEIESKSSTDDEVIEDFEKFEGKLDPLEAAALSCILEEASLQLYIIDVGTCSSSPDRSNIIARQKIIEVIDKTLEEVTENGTFNILYEKAKEERESRRTAKSLQKSIVRNYARIDDLKEKLRGHEYTTMREMNKKQEIIASLKDKIHEEITRNDFKLRFIDRWEAAKQGQNRMRCQNLELNLERKLESITNKLNNEVRVHDEVCRFLTLQEENLLEELKKWEERYNKEMEKRKEKIKFLERRRKEQQILYHDLVQLYEERLKDINDYLNFKEKLRIEQEQARFINEMATKIQAWWRGTMVRRGLGPFKKKKKPGKEKKKK